MRIIVYLGPSLPLARARQVLDADYRPPAAQTDVLSDLMNHRPDAIALIDGVFMRTNAVWHKELLFALQQGVPVYGASSMGALRAAECDAFGMIGVGAVYRMYALGDLIDDDEVALVHGPPDSDYHKTSEPMVNLRATFAAARDRGILDEAEHQRICTVAKQLHFADRVFPVIFARAREQGLAAATVDAVARFVRSDYVDVKANDALELLELLARPETLRNGKPRAVDLRMTSGFLTMYNCDRRVVVDDVPVSLGNIVRYAAVNVPDYNVLSFNAMNRFATVCLARLLGIEVTDEEIEAETLRFRNRCGLAAFQAEIAGVGKDEQEASTPVAPVAAMTAADDADASAAFAGWLAKNHLSRDDFTALMRETVWCRKIHRWILYARWTERCARPVLDQLRWENRYAEWTERAAAQERLLQAGGNTYNSIDAWGARLPELIAEHREWSDLVIDTDVTTWAEDVGFHRNLDLKLELLRARCARETLMKLVHDTMGDADGHASADR